MNKMISKIARHAAFAFLLTFQFAVQAQNNIKEPLTIEDKIKALLQKMTLEEKIGQMNQYNGFWEITGPAPAEGDAKKNTITCAKGW